MAAGVAAVPLRRVRRRAEHPLLGARLLWSYSSTRIAKGKKKILWSTTLPLCVMLANGILNYCMLQSVRVPVEIVEVGVAGLGRVARAAAVVCAGAQ